MDEVSAPDTYEDLYRHYYGYVVGLCVKLGIDSQGSEDVAQAILLRFYERDFLKEFNPDLEFSYRGDKRQARFKSFLSAFVKAYVRGYREKQQRQLSREPLKCDQPVGDGTSSWIEVFGPALDDSEKALAVAEESLLVAQIVEYLEELPDKGRRSHMDIMDLPRLFMLVVIQVRLYGQINAKELEQAFRVSNTAVHSWLKELRQHILNYFELDRERAALEIELRRRLALEVSRAPSYRVFRTRMRAGWRYDAVVPLTDRLLFDIWNSSRGESVAVTA